MPETESGSAASTNIDARQIADAIRDIDSQISGAIRVLLDKVYVSASRGGFSQSDVLDIVVRGEKVGTFFSSTYHREAAKFWMAVGPANALQMETVPETARGTSKLDGRIHAWNFKAAEDAMRMFVHEYRKALGRSDKEQSESIHQASCSTIVRLVSAVNGRAGGHTHRTTFRARSVQHARRARRAQSVGQVLVHARYRDQRPSFLLGDTGFI